jgi:hypothetical protein
MSSISSDLPDADADVAEPIDPALVNLRQERPRSKVVAIAILVLAVALFMRLRADLAYAIRAQTPDDLGDARALKVELKDNTLVTLAGLPDRRHALAVNNKGELTRQTLLRLPSNGPQLFVRTIDNNTNPDPQNRWTGRLRRASTQPYTQALHEAFAGMRARHYLQVSTLREAVRAKQNAVVDRTGAKVTLVPDADVQLGYPHEDQLEVLMSGDQYPTLADAQHELTQLGLTVKSSEAHGKSYSLVVTFPIDKHDAILTLLEQNDIAYRFRYEYVTKKLAELNADDAATWQGLTAASVAEPIEVSDDAFVLTEGETPQKFLWAPLLMLIVAVFAGINAMYLVRRLRTRS